MFVFWNQWVISVTKSLKNITSSVTVSHHQMQTQDHKYKSHGISAVWCLPRLFKFRVYNFTNAITWRDFTEAEIHFLAFLFCISRTLLHDQTLKEDANVCAYGK